MQWSNEILIFYIFELNKKSHLFGFWTLKYRAATSSFDNKATISCFDCFEIGLKNMYFFSWFESFVSIKIMGSATQALRADLDSSFFWLLHFLPAPKSLKICLLRFSSLQKQGAVRGPRDCLFYFTKILARILTRTLTKILTKKNLSKFLPIICQLFGYQNLKKFNLLFGSCFVNLIAMIKILTKTPYQNPYRSFVSSSSDQNLKKRLFSAVL